MATLTVSFVGCMGQDLGATGLKLPSGDVDLGNRTDRGGPADRWPLGKQPARAGDERFVSGGQRSATEAPRGKGAGERHRAGSPPWLVKHGSDLQARTGHPVQGPLPAGGAWRW